MPVNYPKPKGPLYHYTSQAGLLGIIQKKQIWATNMLFLNDSAELNHAIRLVKDAIHEIEGSMSLEEATFIKGFGDDLDLIINWIDYQRIAGIYVCSFSENKDQLSQWRGYCPNGNGFSIGFNFSSPLYNSLIEAQNFCLLKCEYGDSEQKSIARQFVNDVINTFRIDGQDIANQKAWADFRKTAPRIKDPTFYEEAEWRLVYLPPKSDSGGPRNIKFREGKSMLIPYLEIELTELIKEPDVRKPLEWIPEIYVGPTQHQALSCMSLDILLKTQGVSNIISKEDKPEHTRVSASEIPYRVG